MEIIQLDGGQLVITGTDCELTALQELIEAAADAVTDIDAQDAIWRYHELLGQEPLEE